MSTYTYTTLVDEARLAINMKGTEKVFTDAEIKRWIFARLRSVETTYTFQKISTTLFAMLGSSDYGFWLWNPTITGVDVTGTATGASSPTILIDSNATFITDGITVGQTVTLDVGGNTATVVSIQSETQLTTTALSATGNYDAGEAYTITTVYLINARGSIEVTAGQLPAAANPAAHPLQVCSTGIIRRQYIHSSCRSARNGRGSRGFKICRDF